MIKNGHYLPKSWWALLFTSSHHEILHLWYFAMQVKTLWRLKVVVAVVDLVEAGHSEVGHATLDLDQGLGILLQDGKYFVTKLFVW